MKSNLSLAAILVLALGCSETPEGGGPGADTQVSTAANHQRSEGQLGSASGEAGEKDGDKTGGTTLHDDYPQFASDYRRMVAEQEAAIAKLKKTVGQLSATCQQLSENVERLTPGQQWHERMISANQESYDEIREMLQSLTDEGFPAGRTWYGESWNELTAPFQVGRFPEPEQRDALLQLLDEMTDAERKRAAIRAESEENQTAEMALTGYGLGPTWEELYDNLQNLRY